MTQTNDNTHDVQYDHYATSIIDRLRNALIEEFIALRDDVAYDDDNDERDIARDERDAREIQRVSDECDAMTTIDALYAFACTHALRDTFTMTFVNETLHASNVERNDLRNLMNDDFTRAMNVLRTFASNAFIDYVIRIERVTHCVTRVFINNDKFDIDDTRDVDAIIAHARTRNVRVIDHR